MIDPRRGIGARLEVTDSLMRVVAGHGVAHRLAEPLDAIDRRMIGGLEDDFDFRLARRAAADGRRVGSRPWCAWLFS